MENQDPWAQFPDAPTAPAQTDPWAQFPDIQSESVPLINAANNRTDDGRDASGVPSGLSTSDVSPEGTPRGFAPDPAKDIMQPGTEVAPVSNPLNKPLSEHIRDVGDIITDPVKIVAPGLAAQRDKDMKRVMGHEFGDNGIVGDALGGVFNTPRNLAETGLAVADTLSGGKTAESFNEAVPRYEPKPDSKLGQTVTIGTEMIGPGGAANKLFDGLELTQKAITKAPKIMNYLVRPVVDAVGGVAGITPNTDGLLVGEDGYFGSVGDKAELGDGSGQKIVKQKIDLAADALVTGAPVAFTFGLGAKGVALSRDLIFSRFTNLFTKQGQDSEIARSVLTQLGKITPDMDDNQIIQEFEKVVQTINAPENKNLRDQLYGKITPEELAQLTPEQQAALDVKRDTVSAFELGQNPNDLSAVSNARSMREGAIRQGAPDVEASLARPVKAADDYNELLNKQAGGRDAADEAAAVVQQSGRDDAQRIQQSTDDTTAALEAEHKDLSKVVQDDPFGQKVADLGTDVNVNVDKASKDLKTKIGGNLNQKFEADTKQLNDLSDSAAASGAKVDEEALNDAGNTVLSQNTLDPNDQKILQAFVDGESNDHGELFKMTPAITRRINELMNNGKSNQAGPLMRLRDVINNPIGDGEEVAKFRAFYKDQWAPNYKDGIGSDYANLYKDTTRMNKETGIADVQKPFDKESGTNRIVDKAVDDDAYVKQLYGLLDSPEAGHSADDVGSLIVARSMTDVQKTINRTGKFGPEDFDKVVATLEQNGTALSNVSPTQAKRINDLATKVRDRKIELSGLKKEVDDIVKQNNKAQERIFGKELRPFFKEGEFSGYDDVSNGYEAFDKLMTDTAQAKNAAGKTKLDRVIDRVNASDNEVAKEGLQAAWSNSFRDKFFGVADDATGTSKVKTSFVAKEKVGKNELLVVGDKIFKDKPGVMTTMKALVEEADRVSKARSSTSHVVMDSRKIAQEGQGAFKLVTNFLFGPLSRTGSRVNSAGTKILARSDPEGYINKTMSAILADPDEFNKIVMPFIQREKEKAANMSIDDMKKLVRWTVNAGVKTSQEAEMDAMEMAAQRKQDEDNTRKVFPK